MANRDRSEELTSSNRARPQHLKLDSVPDQVLDAIAEAHGLNLGDQNNLAAARGSKDKFTDYILDGRNVFDDEDYREFAEDASDVSEQITELNNPGMFSVGYGVAPANVDADIRMLNEAIKHFQGGPHDEMFALSGSDIAKMGDTRIAAEPVALPELHGDVNPPEVSNRIIPDYILNKTAPKPPEDRGSDTNRQPRLY